MVRTRHGNARTPTSYSIEAQHLDRLQTWADVHCDGNRSAALREMIDTAAMATDGGAAAVIAERDLLKTQLADAEKRLATLKAMIGG
jgi:hypothetical protein